MPISTDEIQPVAGSTAAAPAPSAPAVPELNPDATIPDEVLQIPEFRALLEGAPPAVFAPKGDRSPEVDIIEKNVNPLLEAGFGFYRTKDDAGSVLFNTRFVSGDEIKAADEAGKIATIAPPISELRDFFAKDLQGPEATAPAAAPAQPAVAPASSGVQNRLANARVKNLAPGSPTSGPVPGQGRILNNILKPSV